jgi:lysophospholipase L1-like esterase
VAGVDFARWGRLLVLALVLTLCWAASARAAGGVYVALGDSYTSAPLVPNQHGEPIDCGRSDHNYPSLVAAAFGFGTFVDVSCGSAETKHMTEPQTGLPLGGTNPPQFNALRSDATVVSVGIGGNDAGLVGVAQKCAELGLTAPMGTACRDHWAPGGNDQVAARIDATAPKIAAVLQGIHQRAPNARVAIVGYPDVLPDNGESCYPMVPLSPDDIRYIDSLIVRINGMIAGQAAANNADFVDTYADSGGHDVCKLPPERWFEGLVPTEPAYPMHPNAKGEASMARSAIAVLSRPRPGAIAPPPTTQPSPLTGSTPCLARRARIGRRGLLGVRLGATRSALRRRVAVAPARRTRSAFLYCVKGGGGRVAAVFPSRRRRAGAGLVLTTGLGHRTRGVHTGSSRAALLRAFPNRRSLGSGFFLASARSHKLFWVSKGRVRFIALVSDRLLRRPPALTRAFRAALG